MIQIGSYKHRHSDQMSVNGEKNWASESVRIANHGTASGSINKHKWWWCFNAYSLYSVLQIHSV